MNQRGKLGFYREFLAERDEILRHKDVESEKVGCDVGFERALVDWIEKHRPAWREGRFRQQGFRPGFQPEETSNGTVRPGKGISSKTSCGLAKGRLPGSVAA